VVINLSREATSDYAITLEGSPLTGEVQAIDLLNGFDIPAPVLDSAGGFTGYKPLAEIPARTGLVILLRP
jgi:hypothetical protein